MAANLLRASNQASNFSHDQLGYRAFCSIDTRCWSVVIEPLPNVSICSKWFLQNETKKIFCLLIDALSLSLLCLVVGRYVALLSVWSVYLRNYYIICLSLCPPSQHLNWLLRFRHLVISSDFGLRFSIVIWNCQFKCSFQTLIVKSFLVKQICVLAKLQLENGTAYYVKSAWKRTA